VCVKYVLKISIYIYQYFFTSSLPLYSGQVHEGGARIIGLRPSCGVLVMFDVQVHEGGARIIGLRPSCGVLVMLEIWIRLLMLEPDTRPQVGQMSSNVIP